VKQVGARRGVQPSFDATMVRTGHCSTIVVLRGIEVWDALKKHLQENAFKYIAGIAGSAAVMSAGYFMDFAKEKGEIFLLETISEDLTIKDPGHNSDNKPRDANLARAISNFQARFLETMSEDLLVKDPERNADKSPRDAYLAKAISKFQERFKTFATRQFYNLNHNLIGWVQSGNLKVAYANADKQKQTFNIFVGNSNHVFLEFKLGPFDNENYNISMYFFEEPVCPRHAWETGANNIIQFDVVDVVSRKWKFSKKCGIVYASTSEQEVANSAGQQDLELVMGGHEKQFIQVTLAITNRSPAAIEPEQFRKATTRQAALTTKRNESDQKDLDVSYIAVVAPLVEDVYRKKEAANESNAGE